MHRNNAQQAYVSALSASEFDDLEDAVRERRCRERFGFGNFTEALAIYHRDPTCPKCNSPRSVRDGLGPSGIQRYRCKVCGARFNALSGTVFEHGRKSLACWVDFIDLMRFNVSIEAAACICRMSHQSCWEWRHRIFAAIDGYQDRIVLRDRVWIDEIYMADSELTSGFGQIKKRGLSKQQICIAVAIDIHKNPAAVVCGHGKPSSARIIEALASKIAKGAVIVGDKERAHNALVRAVSGSHEAYKADVRDPVYLECMAYINDLCAWLKRYLRRFTGMLPENLQSYLNWFVYLFRVNQAKDKWPQTERVLRHLLLAKAHFRSKT